MPEIPFDAPDRARYRDVASLIGAHAAAAPGRTFLHAIDEGRSLSFAEMHGLARRFARYFADQGIGRGDRVLVLSENTPRSGRALFRDAFLRRELLHDQRGRSTPPMSGR